MSPKNVSNGTVVLTAIGSSASQFLFPRRKCTTSIVARLIIYDQNVRIPSLQPHRRGFILLGAESREGGLARLSPQLKCHELKNIYIYLYSFLPLPTHPISTFSPRATSSSGPVSDWSTRNRRRSDWSNKFGDGALRFVFVRAVCRRDERGVSADLREISVDHRDIFPGPWLDPLGDVRGGGRRLLRQTFVSAFSVGRVCVSLSQKVRCCFVTARIYGVCVPPWRSFAPRIMAMSTININEREMQGC